jgi:hypothetical protein
LNRIACAIIAAGLIVAGAIVWTSPRKEEVLYLRGEVVKLEALLETALKTMHHERLLHFGEEVAP